MELETQRQIAIPNSGSAVVAIVTNTNSELSPNGDEKVMFAAISVKPHPISFAYRAQFVGCSPGLTSIALLCFALVAAIAFGVWSHLTHNLAFFEAGRYCGIFISYRYAMHCWSGTDLLELMLRPFFIKRIRVAPPREIKAVDEPIVLEFLETKL